MIKIRNARKEDTHFIARMILMALHIPFNENEELPKKMLDLVETEGTLYTWNRCQIAENSPLREGLGEAVGLCLAYDGKDYHERRLHSFDIDQADESGRGEFYVDSLAVIPEMRGKGIGRILVQDAIKRGKKLGLTPTILVDPDNTPAVKLYESVGFKGRNEIFVFGQTYWKMKAL